MKIISHLYSKYILSFSICLISCFTIFFIFSLIGNLNEDYLFNTIINISVLNSLQILIYVSTFIFLLSVILLSIFLRSKNEMIIIKSYVDLKKLLVFFLPLILFFTILEIYKDNLTIFVEDIKKDLTDLNNNSVAKILINKIGKSETYTIFKNFNDTNMDDTEYRFYKISDNEIVYAQYSESLTKSNNKLIANTYTEYNENIIKDFNTKKIFDVNFLDLLNNNSIVMNVSEGKNFFSMININLLIFSSLLLTFIFLIFFDKKYVNTKQSLTYPILLCLLFIIYSFLVFSNSFTVFKQLFELLACLIISMLICKVYFNE